SAGKPEDFCLIVDGNGDFPMLVAFLGRREKMFASVLLPRDRAAKLHRGGRNDRLLGIKRRLCAEAAADVSRDYPDRLEVAFKEIGEGGATKGRRLWR